MKQINTEPSAKRNTHKQCHHRKVTPIKILKFWVIEYGVDAAFDIYERDFINAEGNSQW